MVLTKPEIIERKFTQSLKKFIDTYKLRGVKKLFP